MRDPFRTDTNAQLIREAKIGLSVVAIFLSLFLYIAFQKISGRGRHHPNPLIAAPIADAARLEPSPGVTPDWPTQKEFSDVTSRLATNGADGPAIQRDLKRSETLPSTKDRQEASTTGLGPGIPPGDPGSKKKMSEVVTSRKNAKATGKSRSPGQTENWIGRLLPFFGAGGKQQHRKESQQDLTSPPPSLRSNDFAPVASSTNASRSPLQSQVVSVVEAVAPPDTNSKPRSRRPDGLEHNDLRASNEFMPMSNDPEKIRVNTQPDVQLASAKSDHVRTSVFEEPEKSWPINSASEIPSLKSSSELDAGHLPTLKPAQPLVDSTTTLSQELPRPDQMDIARAVAPVESNASLTVRTPQPPIPADESASSSNSTSYTVRDGDSYWTIAANRYGDGRFFRALYEYNKGVMPGFDLVTGTELATPAKSDLIRLCPDQCPQVESDPKRIDDSSANHEEGNIYVTRSGDTLFEIAGQKLEQASRYLEIYQLNRTRLEPNVNHLSPLPAGLRLVLPPR